MDKEKWVSTKEVSDYIGININTIRIWITQRDFPAVRIGRVWRCKLSNVDEWMKAQNDLYQTEQLAKDE